jgi:serine/threonine-protein kinase
MNNLDASDWPLISALFDQALDLPAALRDEWLAALPEAHRVHRPTLERLLADYALVETQDFLNALPRVGVSAASGEPDPGAAGLRVGPYRLLRELGRGGMGSVWLAERADGLLKRQVALKLPHPGLATRAFGERLARERDILASLAHPHIARLYDAGVSDEGQPYIALAHVQGKTLIEHCTERDMDVRARVILFLQVLAAVQYAHSHLVIHRDIKPSNVLVDEQGQVHLLDFGIAKLLVDGQAEATALTLDAGLALTPDYASPEQIAGGAISIASDIYSLGVLLHELLAGVRPYHLPRQGRTALASAVLEIEPPRPSEAARAAGRPAAAQALRGDLDTIVLKALKKKPEQRYPTVDAFAQDLQRHLDGAPVLARPDAMSYRVGKFVRRHRVGVLAAGLVVLALGVGLAGTTWQARKAQQQARRARAVQEFLVGLFNEADPAKAQGRELTARQMLDRGRRDLEAKLEDQPALQADLEGVLVDLYIKLGDDKKVLPLAEAQRDRALRLEGPQSLAYGDALFALARVHGGLAHHDLALELYDKAAQVLSHHAKERGGELLLIEGHRATQLTMLDRSKEAVDVQVRLLPRLEARFGPDSWELLRARADLAGTYSDQGEHDKAARLVAQVRPGLDRADPAHALDAAEVRINLGYTLWNARQYAVAQALLEKGIAEADRVLGPANATSVEAQRTLGLLFGSEGRFDMAVRTFADSVVRARQLGGEDSAPTRFAESFEVLSLVMTGQGAEARRVGLQSVRQLDHVEGITASMARGFDRRFGLALIAAGDAGKAAQVLEDVLAREAAAGVNKGGAHGTTLLYLAGARAGQGAQAAAAAAASQAAASFAQGEANFVAMAHSRLTEALARARLHETATARSLVAEAQALLAKSAQPNPADPLFIDLVRAELLRGDAQPLEADRIERSARERLKAIGGAAPPSPVVLIF